jgi:predicted negative regulator of RcsB-dependent stress response
MEEKNNEISGVYGKLMNFTEKNKKTLIIAGSLIVLLVAGLTLYNKYVAEPKQKESIELLAQIQEYFKLDSFNLVINGTVGLKSAVQISKEYSRTKSGNLARYYAGVSYLKIGDYDNAISYLKQFKAHDDYLIGALALGCIGDAYVEKGDMNTAAKYYSQALNYNKLNEVTTPIYTRKLLNIYIENKSYDKALKEIESLLKNDEIEDKFKYELHKYKGYIESLSEA